MIPITKRIGLRHIQRGTVELDADTENNDHVVNVTLSGFTNSEKMYVILNGNTDIDMDTYNYTNLPYVASITPEKLVIKPSRSYFKAISQQHEISYQVIEYY